MQECLSYPFDSLALLKQRKKIKRELLADNSSRIKKNIAFLGGSTTNDIAVMLELFLLNNGIEPTFYQSEFGQYWQDAMFSDELEAFKPDVIFIHTTTRNLFKYDFNFKLSKAEMSDKLNRQYTHFEEMWEKLKERFNCPIIQNNFEQPDHRVLGNSDFSDVHGKVNFVNKMNSLFADYADKTKNFYIHDINWLSAFYGLERWADPLHWYMYKYALSMEAIPTFAHSLSNIIKSIYGKNKKALVLDLDNTLWGGVVGDDGVNNLEIGKEVPSGQAYYEFQTYIQKLKSIGVTLTIASKNDENNAIDGLNHPDGVLRPNDFTVIKANWNSKDNNIEEIYQELNILPDSLVFLDDNPAEREIVKSMQPAVSIPQFDGVENYVRILDQSGFFEVTAISEDDLKRNEMYKANMERLTQQKKFASYEEYLLRLDMVAKITAFEPIYFERITQLTNKSNQFNLTTRRYTAAEIEAARNSDSHITLYGRLVDKFGDNGIVSVVIGEVKGDELDIQLWLMSCRVLKRDMELAMLDTFVEKAKEKGVKKLNGYYYKTAKNNMVSKLYETFGFTLVEEKENGDSVWTLDISQYEIKNKVINVEK